MCVLQCCGVPGEMRVKPTDAVLLSLQLGKVRTHRHSWEATGLGHHQLYGSQWHDDVLAISVSTVGGVGVRAEGEAVCVVLLKLKKEACVLTAKVGGVPC